MKLMISFTYLIWLLFGSSVLADKIKILNESGEAAQARLDLIVKAQSEINIEYFIFGYDSISLGGLSLLREAARNHKTVRMIIDAPWMYIPQNIMAYLMDEGIQIRVFHPFRFTKLNWISRRMHDKLLLIDSSEMLTGGRNVENSYFGVSEDRNYVDRDIYANGAAAKKANEYFVQLWNSQEVSQPDLGIFSNSNRNKSCVSVKESSPRAICRREASKISKGLVDAKYTVDGATKTLLNSKLVDMKNHRDWETEAKEIAEVNFVHDRVGKTDGHQGTASQLISLFQNAKRSITIESPYLVPTKEFIQLITELKSRSSQRPTIRIMTNSLKSSDNMAAQAAYIKEKKHLIDLGIELWEYQGPESLHAKSAVIDDSIGIVGSYNLDPRSQNLNTEVALVFRDQELATALHLNMNRHLERATHITPGNEYLRSLEIPRSLPNDKLLELWLLLPAMKIPLIYNQM